MQLTIIFIRKWSITADYLTLFFNGQQSVSFPAIPPTHNASFPFCWDSQESMQSMAGSFV